MKVTKQDEQALRAALRRKPRKFCELRHIMVERFGSRLFADPSSTAAKANARARVAGSWRERRRLDQASQHAIYRVSCNALTRLLRSWKRQGLVDNPVRGTWQWVGK